MSDPAAWADMSGALPGLMPGLPASARATGGADPGDVFIRTFFGSETLSAAVARQAAAFAGIAPAAMEKLMPSLAVLAMQAMARGAVGAVNRNAPDGWATGDVGAATAEMMRRGANAVEALSRPSNARQASAAPFDAGFPAVFAESWRTMLEAMRPPFPQPDAGAAKARKPEAPDGPSDPAAPFAAPFAAMFEAFARTMGTGLPGFAEAPARPPPAAAPPPVSNGNTLPETYARAMAALFERHAGKRDGA